MLDIEKRLAQLSTAPVDPRLAELEDRVFARIHDMAARDRHAPPRLAAAAAIGAAVMGIAGAGLPVAPASSAATLAPFGMAASLAPSTLLLGDR